MAKKIGFESNSSGDIYTYLEDGAGGSCAVGQDFGDSSKFKIVMAGVPGATPSGSAQLTIDPSTNGNITLTPKGAGEVEISYLTTGVVLSDSSGQLTSSNGTNGQLLIGRFGSQPLWNTLTEGTGISIVNTSGNITISSSTGGMTWTEVTTTSSSLAVNNGYIANNAGLVTLTLPTTAVLGDTITILGKGAGLWKLAQNASQFVNIINTTTTTGVTGSLTATEQFDCLTVTCTTANNGWTARPFGNFTVA